MSLPKGREGEALLDRMKQGVLSGTSFEDHAALGTAFHETILERASNPLLIAIARSSCRVISKYLMFQQWRTLYTTEELFQRHNSMYEAFLTRNPYTIEEAVRAHYADSAERLAQICEAEQKPKTARSSAAPISPRIKALPVRGFLSLTEAPMSSLVGYRGTDFPFPFLP
ncbi:MAG: FCD domain-containing protein [Bilophila wadsworthia]